MSDIMWSLWSIVYFLRSLTAVQFQFMITLFLHFMILAHFEVDKCPPSRREAIISHLERVLIIPPNLPTNEIAKVFVPTLLS